MDAAAPSPATTTGVTMGLFDRAKKAAGGAGQSGTGRSGAGQDWAAQAAQAQELANQAMRDAGYGADTSAASSPQVQGQMYADREVLTAYGQELNRIIAIGQPGTSVIVAATDTGERVSGNPWYQLEVEVTLPGSDPYTVSKREMVAPQFLANYAVGSAHEVAVDPADPQKIAFTS